MFSAKMIRHYESIGVIPPAGRTFSNIRVYSQNDVHTLPALTYDL